MIMNVTLHSCLTCFKMIPFLTTKSVNPIPPGQGTLSLRRCWHCLTLPWDSDGTDACKSSVVMVSLLVVVCAGTPGEDTTAVDMKEWWLGNAPFSGVRLPLTTFLTLGLLSGLPWGWDVVTPPVEVEGWATKGEEDWGRKSGENVHTTSRIKYRAHQTAM